MRKLEIAPDRPAFVYQWIECRKRFLGICTKEETVVEYYDLTNPQVRQKLRDMGFLASVWDRKL